MYADLTTRLKGKIMTLTTKRKTLNAIVNLFGEKYFSAGDGRRLQRIENNCTGAAIYQAPIRELLSEEQFDAIEHYADDAVARTNAARKADTSYWYGDFSLRTPVKDWKVQLEAIAVYRGDDGGSSTSFGISTFLRLQGVKCNALYSVCRDSYASAVFEEIAERKQNIISRLDNLYNVLKSYTDITGHDADIGSMNFFVLDFAGIPNSVLR